MAAVFASVVQCPLEHVKCQMQAKRIKGDKTERRIQGTMLQQHISSVRVVYRGLGEINTFYILKS